MGRMKEKRSVKLNILSVFLFNEMKPKELKVFHFLWNSWLFKNQFHH